MRCAPLVALPALLATLLAACAPTAVLMTPPPSVNPPPGRADETTGGVAFSAGGSGSSVAYGPWRVKGAGIDLAYAGEGTWSGTWNGAPARFVATQGQITGPATSLLLQQASGKLSIRGTWSGRPVEVSLGRAELRGLVGRDGCTLTLVADGAGVLAGPVGCPAAAGSAATGSAAALRLMGEAILVPDVLLPQLVLALLACLP